MGRGRDSEIAPTEDGSVFVNQRQMRLAEYAESTPNAPNQEIKKSTV